MAHVPSGKNENCLENMICPECGNEDKFLVRVTTFVALTDDGTDPLDFAVKHISDHEYDEESVCVCAECDISGKVGDFTVDYETRIREQALDMVRQIARLSKEGEETDGEPYDWSDEDAYQTIHSLISGAREIMLSD